MAATLEELKNPMAVTDVMAVTIETADKNYLIKTGSEVGIKARVDAGNKKPLRKGNTIYAQNNTEDIILGYDIDLTDILMHPEVLAMVEGGVVTSGETGITYTGPVIGKETKRTSFTLTVYSANRDTGSNALNYLKLTFPGCKGKSPVEWSLKDGEFFTPKYTLESAPAFGQAPMTMSVVEALPAVAG